MNTTPKLNKLGELYDRIQTGQFTSDVLPLANIVAQLIEEVQRIKHEAEEFRTLPIPNSPLVNQAHELCMLIEGLPASEKQTAISLKASDLLRRIKASTGHDLLSFQELSETFRAEA